MQLLHSRQASVYIQYLTPRRVDGYLLDVQQQLLSELGRLPAYTACPLTPLNPVLLEMCVF